MGSVLYKTGQSQGVWNHREALTRSLAGHRGSGPNLYEGSSIDWPFNIRAAVGRELFHIIMNELRVHLSPEGGLIVAGQVIGFNGDAVTTSPAPANRASCPGWPFSTSQLIDSSRNCFTAHYLDGPFPAPFPLFSSFLFKHTIGR